MMILATLCDLAHTLQCRPDQAEDVVRSEPSARAALSRRGLFKAAGAVAAGSCFSFGQPLYANDASFLRALHLWEELVHAETDRVFGIMRMQALLFGASVQSVEEIAWKDSGYTEEQLRPRVY